MTGPLDPPYPGPQDPRDRQDPQQSQDPPPPADQNSENTWSWPEQPQWPQNPPPQGYQQPGYSPPQNPSGYPPQGYPAQGYPPPQHPSGYPPQGYGSQGYPSQGYPPPQYQQDYPPGFQPSYPPTGQPAARQGSQLDLATRLGERLKRRPAPRAGAALAGAGAGLTVVGLLTWSSGYIIQGLGDVLQSGSASDGSSRQDLGGLLFLLLAIVGYALVVRVERGPLATVGVVAGALSVPLSVAFFSFGITSGPDIDATFWVSFLVWLGSYLFLRGARGHTFYLAASLYFLAVYAVSKVDGSAVGDVISRGIGQFQSSGGDTGSVSSGGAGGLALAFGLAYYLAAWALDRRGAHGPALAFALVGFPITAAGILALSPDLETGGTGVLLLVVGIVLALYGGSSGRRFTTWIWSLGAVVGVALIVADVVGTGDTDVVTAGVSLAVGGAVLVAFGVLLARVTGEPDSMDIAEPEALQRVG